MTACMTSQYIYMDTGVIKRIWQIVICLICIKHINFSSVVIELSDVDLTKHTFVEINREIFSTVILLLLLIQEGFFSVTSKGMCTEYWLSH